MTWQEAVATMVVLAGLGAGAFLVARRPAFWVEFGFRTLRTIAPPIWCWLSKRMSLEEEKAMQEAYRRGQGDEWLRRRQGSLKDR